MKRKPFKVKEVSIYLIPKGVTVVVEVVDPDSLYMETPTTMDDNVGEIQIVKDSLTNEMIITAQTKYSNADDFLERLEPVKKYAVDAVSKAWSLLKEIN